MNSPKCHLRTPPTFFILCLLAWLLRLVAAYAGDNYDMESWWIASEAFNRHESVYAATHRYNYGPIWFGILGCLRYLSSVTGEDTITRLHLFVTSFLSLVDIALALWIFRRTRRLSMAALFALNPVSILVTGYHIQFDNLALLLGILSWEIFSTGTDKRSLLLASALLGASLSTKHIFSIFLAWLPFLTTVRTLSQRGIYGAIALTVFALSFVPWLNEPHSIAGIEANVLRYTSTEGHSLISSLWSWFPLIPQRTLFVGLLAVIGTLFARTPKTQAYAAFIYLVLLTALSSGMARNYLAIPLVPLVMLSRCACSWVYWVAATLALVSISPTLGVSEVALPLTSVSFVTYQLLQLILLGFLAEFFCKRLYEKSDLPSASKTRASI